MTNASAAANKETVVTKRATTMRSHARVSLAICLIAIGAIPSWAGGAASPFDFLFLDANARVVGMGGAYTALAADSNALLYNPAGLAGVQRHEATFMHNQYVEGVTQQYLGFAARQGWGLQLNRLSFGDIPRTTISNKEGTGLGSFGIMDLALGGGYARRISSDLNLGAGLKYLRESIESVSVGGFALDVGALYSVPRLPRLSLGFALQNLGPAVKFQRDSEPLPMNLRVGAAYGFTLRGSKTTVAFDVAKAREEGPAVAFGLETIVAGRLPLRLGYKMRNDAGPGIAIGLGWIRRDISFDYAFVPFGDLGNSHRLSATLRWGTGTAAVLRPVPSTTTVSTRAQEFAMLVSQAAQLTDNELAPQAKARLQEAASLLHEPQPAKGDYFVVRGRVALLEKDIPEAIANFEEALRLAESNGTTRAAAHAGLGACLLLQKDIDGARKHFRLGLESGPTPATRKMIEDQLQQLER